MTRYDNGDHYHKGFWITGATGYFQIFEEAAYDMLRRNVLKSPIHAARVLSEAKKWIEDTIKSNPLLAGLRPEYPDGLLSVAECRAILTKQNEGSEQ